MAVLRPEHAPSIITPLDRRADLLVDAGADHVLALAFDMEMAGWTPQQFVDRVLVEALQRAGRGGRRQLPLRPPGRRRRGDAAGGRRAAGFTAVGVELEGGPQVWSSTYVRTCLAAGDVAGAAEALGHLFAVRGVVVEGDQSRPRARVPDRERAGGSAGGGPRRRRVRRLAAPGRRRHVVPRRDQRRHQPDVRRTARAARRGLRARPHRPGALRRRGRGRLRRAAPGDGPVRRRRRPRSRPCTTTWPGPARSWASDVATSAELRDVERWFVAHGLPYFVDDIREQVLSRLSRPRIVLVLTVAVLVGAAAGVVVGTLTEASFGVSTAASVALGLTVVYALLSLRAQVIAGWALRRAFRSLGLLLPAAHPGAAAAAAVHHVPVHQRRGLAGLLDPGRRHPVGRGAVLRRRGGALPGAAAGRGARRLRRLDRLGRPAGREQGHPARGAGAAADRRGHRPARGGPGDRPADGQPGAGPGDRPGRAGAAARGRGVRVLHRVRRGRDRRQRHRVLDREDDVHHVLGLDASARSCCRSRSSWRRSPASTSPSTRSPTTSTARSSSP